MRLRILRGTVPPWPSDWPPRSIGWRTSTLISTISPGFACGGRVMRALNMALASVDAGAERDNDGRGRDGVAPVAMSDDRRHRLRLREPKRRRDLGPAGTRREMEARHVGEGILLGDQMNPADVGCLRHRAL